MPEHEPETYKVFESRLSAGHVRNTACGFCGKGREEVAQLIVGLTPEIAICNECTEWCWEIASGNEVSAERLDARQS